ncbi:NAD-dependent epimerase [Umezawaea tangerina]|uniref:Nucleoside-diphosphate-sugar epimerase n=1 Tax=Umezawaea tangerina TaxID=84725 RepID=A0A2T0SE33_9PSEU|nr:NAD-dependent epimerase [Umezawaea tangerina]PRY31676.1 nucleoside-diphosphate-sugar epimerase [Umezawaea tangerina]
MSLHVVVGSGPVGSGTASLLASRGERVRVVSRSGGGPDHPNVERVAASATDAGRLSALAEGAVALYNCVNPAYHQWLTDWPPIASALLTAAERSGAVYVMTGSLYGYGEVDGPMTAATPLAATHPKLKLKADMWRAALAAHEAGRIRATEVRGSDYIEANSIFTFGLGKPLLAGRKAWSPAPLDVPHSWTSIADVVAALTTAATDERAWGRAWAVPTEPPLTVRELATRFTAVAGVAAPKLGRIPTPALRAIGLFSPMVKELRTTAYQFARPFVLDSGETTEVFGLKPRPIDDSLREAVRSLA